MSKTLFRILAMCLTFSLLISALTLATPAHAAEIIASGECGDKGNNVTWTLDSDGLLTISGTGEMDSRPWLYYKYDIETVVIESGVTWVEYEAFSDCANLTSVTIPESVKVIGYGAFTGCTALTTITIPDGVSYISGELFYGCSNLSAVTIPDHIEGIGQTAFFGCNSLTNINIPESVTEIGERAFAGCSSLADITIPSGVTSIARGTFSGCSSLTSIIIPESVSNIDDSAFSGCDSLSSINIPKGVINIDEEAFSNCDNLKGIWVDEENACYSSDSYGVLFTKDKSELIQAPGAISGSYSIPASVSKISYHSFSYCGKVKEIILSKKITGITKSSFRECASLTDITIPDGVSNIEDYAFFGCSSLTDVSIPGSVTSIGDSAFKGCSSLKSVTIPDGVTSIGTSVFYGCSNLKSVTIPDSVTNIGWDAFYGCSSLKSVTIPDSVTSIGEYAFSGCSSLTSITIPTGVTSINQGTFSACSSVSNIVIPESVTEIDTSAFYGCAALEKILVNEANVNYSSDSFGALYTKDKSELILVPGALDVEFIISASVTKISWSAFRDCSKLENIRVDKTNPNYCINNDGVLLSKDNAEIIWVPCALSGNYNIPTGVSSVRNYAFSNCTKLTSITIPTTVTSIGSSAFKNCSGLSSIIVPESVQNIGSGAFNGCSGLKSLTIPFIDLYQGNNEYLPVVRPFGEFFGSEQYTGGTNTTQKVPDYNNGYLMSIDFCIPDKLTSVTVTGGESNSWAFNCTSICEVVLGEGVDGIGISAFENCGSLRSIVISKNVKSISWSAFNGCTSLTDVYYTGTEEEWKAVNIESDNEPLLNATIHYNYVPEDAPGDSGDKATVEGANRAFGGNRYDTAFKAADLLKEQLGVEKFDAIVVADGLNFADALSGSYLAAVKNAPILLVRNNKTTMQQVKDYIKANLVSGGTVYLLGGVNAVPKAMETGLEGFAIKRLGGANRYETNLLILKEAGVGDKDILVCTGKGFADSLSASAAERPILLVKDSFTSAQKDFLKDAKGKLYIIGGTSAVSAKVESALKAYGEVKRLGGNTRYETSVLVAQEFFDKPTAIVLAYAQNFPDGLSGGALAAGMNAPLILTASGKDAAAAKYAKDLGIKDGFVLGGTTLINDKAVKNIFSTDTVK